MVLNGLFGSGIISIVAPKMRGDNVGIQDTGKKFLTVRES